MNHSAATVSQISPRTAVSRSSQRPIASDGITSRPSRIAGPRMNRSVWFRVRASSPSPWLVRINHAIPTDGPATTSAIISTGTIPDQRDRTAGSIGGAGDQKPVGCSVSVIRSAIIRGGLLTGPWDRDRTPVELSVVS